MRDSDLKEARDVLREADPPIEKIEDLERVKQDSEELAMLVRFLIEANIFGTKNAGDEGDMSRIFSPVHQKSRGSPVVQQSLM